MACAAALTAELGPIGNEPQGGAAELGEFLHQYAHARARGIRGRGNVQAPYEIAQPGASCEAWRTVYTHNSRLSSLLGDKHDGRW